MKKKGFTLIELMITLSIFVIFIGFVYNAYFSQIRMSNNMNSAYNAEVNAKNIIKVISSSIRKESSTEAVKNKSVLIKVSDTKIDETDSTGKFILTIAEFDSVNKKIKIKDKTDIDCKSQGIEDIKFSKSQDSNIIQITVSALDKYGTFTLETGINIFD